MRILYIDIDSLRPDHLGCYGYSRDTSPNIDALAAGGVRFTNVYASDAPCLPSRTALWSGRCGFRNGVVNHGGSRAEPFSEGASRGVADIFHDTGWMPALRSAGYHTATVSSFAERHSAWHWYAGYNEIYNNGKEGMDRAHDVTPIALDWLERNGSADQWFLHVNYWDPHIPYRTPMDFGRPFAEEPLPEWLTGEVWRAGWDGFGPHSPQEPHGYGDETYFNGFPRFPASIDSMEAVRAWIDGYDTGVRYMDDHVGRLVDALRENEIYDDTLIMVSADHGENLGELNVWGDHETADDLTCRVPLIVSRPGVSPRVDEALHYNFDWAATLVELAGGRVPSNWDGESFAPTFEHGEEDGRDYLVVSQGAWACQRGVRFNYEGTAFFCMITYHDGYKMVEPEMLFNLDEDPHEQHDLSDEHPELVDRATRLLTEWQRNIMRSGDVKEDPLMAVMREGPLHTRGNLPDYLTRLRATGRAEHARRLERIHQNDLD